jgi:hypothetical protein
MYQVSNPYTGQDTRAIMPGWSLRGLGILGDSVDRVATNINSTGTSTTGATNITVADLENWVAQHPGIQEFYKRHPRLRRRTVTRIVNQGLGQIPGYDMPIEVTTTTDSGTTVPIGTITPPITSVDSGGGFNWNVATPIITAGLNDAMSIAKMVLTPGGSYSVYNPQTGQMVNYQGTGAATTSYNPMTGAFSSSGTPASPLMFPGLSTSSNTGMVPLLLISGIIIIVIAASSKGGGGSSRNSDWDRDRDWESYDSKKKKKK